MTVLPNIYDREQLDGVCGGARSARRSPPANSHEFGDLYAENFGIEEPPMNSKARCPATKRFRCNAAMHDIVLTPGAPNRSGPYSQAVRRGSDLYCSGQIPIDPQTGEIVDGDVSAQAERVLENLGAVLTAAGLGFADVVKTTIFLIDMNDFAAVNAVYGKYFGAIKPARSTVAVAALPKGARIEIDCIASAIAFASFDSASLRSG